MVEDRPTWAGGPHRLSPRSRDVPAADDRHDARDHDGVASLTPQVDGELEDARWFTFEEIDAALVRDGNDDGAGLLLSPSISIARALIEHWHAGMRTRRVDAPMHAETGH